MKLACCDIGNTKVKIGVFEDHSLTHFFPFDSIKEAIRFLRTTKPDAIAISSVVPEKSSAITDFSRYELGTDSFTIDHKTKLSLNIDYSSPLTLGIDRICTSEGAYKLFCENAQLKSNEVILVVDLGTAATFNLISYPDVFSGGIIAPGPGLLFKAMRLYTAQLPEASHDDYKQIIGDDTKSCIASGIVNSVIGLAERVHQQLSVNQVVAATYITGGNSYFYLDKFSFRFSHVPELLIVGMKSIYEKNN